MKEEGRASSFSLRPSSFFRFFAGKGGVGKSTLAAAHAVAAARAGERTLLVSTDPAPSLGDALRQRLTSSPRRVTGAGGQLHALEIDAGKVLERWLAPRRDTLEAIAVRGSWLDREDVAALLRLSLPGIDEVAALLEVGRLGRTGRYDLVVVDTAPTGHTLRMLGTPDLLRTLAAVFDRMQAKHRAMGEALRGRWRPEDADALIASVDEEGRALAELLADPARAAFTLVTLPEPMAVAETIDALRELTRLELAVPTLVVNRLTPPPDRTCAWCRARRRFEHAAVRPLLRDDGVPETTRIAAVSARAREPRGAATLAAMAAEMESSVRWPRPGVATSRARARMTGRGRAAALPGEDSVSLLLFGGKGGVGKTTCAAAAAIALAARRPGRQVLLMSADPAHSLADVLGVALGDDPRRVAGAPTNLRVRELDASVRFEAIKTRYRDAIDALFARLVRGSSMDATADRQAMRDLIELAPPGIDELIAIVEVSDALERSDSSAPLVVLDTAPSGHALRLLEMPAVVHDWVKALMGILLKYRPVVGVGELGAVLLQMSQGLGRLRALLVDPTRTAFVVVTRPAALPAAETARLIARLRRLGVPVPAVIVNAFGAGTCGLCTVAFREQQRALGPLRKSPWGRGTAVVAIAPATVPPPHGPGELKAWRAAWTN